MLTQYTIIKFSNKQYTKSNNHLKLFIQTVSNANYQKKEKQKKKLKTQQ